MSNTAYQFNALQYEPIGPAVENWPDGWVLVVATDVDVKANAGGNSGRASYQIKALEGPMKDKNHFIGLNLWHDNQQTVEIANRQLSAMVYVTIGANKGQYNFGDFHELLNIPFYALAQNKTDDKNVTRTNFVGFRDQKGVEPKAQQQGGGPGPGNGPGPSFQQPQNPGPGPGNGGWNQPNNGAPTQTQQPPNNGGGGWAPPNNNGAPPANQGWAPPPNQQQTQQANPPAGNGGWAPNNGGGAPGGDQAPWRR